MHTANALYGRQVERGYLAALLALVHGATAVRTHADVGKGIGLRAAKALIRVRDELRPLLDMQVVASPIR